MDKPKIDALAERIERLEARELPVEMGIGTRPGCGPRGDYWRGSEGQ